MLLTQTIGCFSHFTCTFGEFATVVDMPAEFVFAVVVDDYVTHGCCRNRGRGVRGFVRGTKVCIMGFVDGISKDKALRIL